MTQRTALLACAVAAAGVFASDRRSAGATTGAERATEATSTVSARPAPSPSVTAGTSVPIRAAPNTAPQAPRAESRAASAPRDNTFSIAPAGTPPATRAATRRPTVPVAPSGSARTPSSGVAVDASGAPTSSRGRSSVSIPVATRTASAPVATDSRQPTGVRSDPQSGNRTLRIVSQAHKTATDRRATGDPAASEKRQPTGARSDPQSGNRTLRIVSQEHKTATDRRAETRVNTAWPRHEPIDGRSDSFRNTPAHAVYVSSSQHGARRYAPTFQTQTPTPARIGADRTHPRGLFDSGRPPAIYRPLHARLPYTPPIVYSSWFFGWRGDACSFCASSYAPFGLYSFWGCGWSGWATPYRTPVWSSPVGSWRRCYPVTVAYVWDPWPVYRSYYFYEYEPAPVAQAEAVYAAPVTAAVAQPIPATTPSADAPTDAGIPAAVTPSADATGSADREAEYGLALPAYQIPEELFVLDFVSYAETLDSGAIWASYAAMDRQDGEEEPYLELETAAQNP